MMNDSLKPEAIYLQKIAMLQQQMADLEARVAELEGCRQHYQQMTNGLTNLLALSQKLVSTKSINTVFDHAIQTAVEIAPVADRGSIQLLDQTGHFLETVAVSGSMIDLAQTIIFQPGVGIAGHALVTGQMINVADVLVDNRFIQGQLPLRFRSLLVTPLIRKNQRLGTLSLTSEKVAAFNQVHESFIQLMVDQIAILIENAQLLKDCTQAQVELQFYRLQT